LAVLTVTTNNDVVDFNDGVLSLREAIFVANTYPGLDEIEFDFGHDGPETIVLTEGELAITDSLTITGAGAALLTIDASGSDPTPDENNGDGSRVLLFDDGVRDNRFTAELRGLTITGGDSDDLRGGGIHSREHLTVRECVISGNAIRNEIGDDDLEGWGGGIQSLYGNLTIVDSTLSGNSSTVAGGAIDFNRVSFDVSLSIVNSTIVENSGGTRGGGILIAGDATITDTLIDENEALEGGGIAIWSNATDADISIENSQITNNRARAGAGVYSNSNAATFLIVGSAITGNEAEVSGGGILMQRSGPLAANAYSLEIRASTISGNRALGEGGILAIDSTGGTGTAVKIESSRIAENKLPVATVGPGGGLVARGTARLVVTDSVVEANDGMGIQAVGVSQSPGVLRLERTQVSGNGRAGVHARDLSSTLLDSTVAGNGDDGVVKYNGPLNVVGGMISDNRGSGIYSRTGDVNITGAAITGNTSSQAGGGVYIFQGALTVTSSTISGNASVIGGGGVHHRSNNTHALRITESTIDGNAGGSGGGVYTSESAYIADSIIAQNRAVTSGGGIAGLNRVVLVRSAVSENRTTGNVSSGGGVSATGAADLVLLVDSSVSNNVATGGGGGIHSVATVQLRRSNVSDNAALKQGGGGILAPGRTISVIDSTLSGNRTVGPNSPGGGIVGGTVTISQSTISNNRTENLISPGGGIFANQLTLHQSTVAANRAMGENSLGGGIHLSGALTLNGSIIADNTAGGGNPDIRTGSVAATNYALIGSTAGLTTVQLNVITLGSGNQLNVDPQLGPLAYNGGPTFADGTRMKTHALLAGSPAIDAGDSALSGPVTMYRFEEIAGTTVEDLVGTQDGSYHGGVELGQAASPIVGGQAVLFDGVDDRATVPASVANDFSFSLWVKTPQLALGGVRIGLIDADAVNAMPGFGLYVESGRIVFRAAGNPVTALTPINDNNWHHVAVTRHAMTGARNVYVDGVLRGSATGGITGALADVAEWQIGRLIAGVGHFVGALDELAVYDRVLSTEEIARHAAAGAPVFDQRGEPHLRVLDGDAAEDIAIDIGAYERAFGETYTFVVDTMMDESDGDFSAGDFSLREAIELANANPGADAIEFDPALWAEGPATIVLTMVDNDYDGIDSALGIKDSLVLHGPGAYLLTIDASGIDPTPELNNGDGGRVITVFDPNSTEALEVEISGLTIRGGDVGSDGSAFADGGGIKVHFVQFALLDCVVTDNSTMGGGGGASIYSEHSAKPSIIERSVFEGNRAAGGGGLAASAGFTAPMIVRNSLFTNNVAMFDGGGIGASSQSFFDQAFILENCTVSENIAMRGAGVYLHDAGRAIIRRTTITKNTATTLTGSSGVFAHSGTLELSHSIVAWNEAADGTLRDLGHGEGSVFDEPGAFGASFSLISANTGSGLEEAPVGAPDAAGNLIGGLVSGVIDPGLGPLANNGGPTKTHTLLPGSPAIDAGDPLAVAGMDGVPEFDQRGMPWGRVVNGDDVPEARIDMGAVEWQANPLAGDYNFNGVVDAADYSVWRDTVGSTNDLRADGSSELTPGAPDGVVDEHDYAWWKANFGRVLGQGVGSREPGVGGEQRSGAGAAVNRAYELQATERKGIGTAEQVSSGNPNAVLASRDVFDVQPAALPGVASVVGAYWMDTSADEVDAGLPLADSETEYPAGVGERADVAAVARDSGLLAWMAQRLGAAALDNKLDGSRVESPDGDEGAGSRDCAVLDELYALADLGW